MVKSRPNNHYAIKTGDAQSKDTSPAALKTLYEGPKPPGYEVMQKQGAVILGIGGDNSPWAAGTWLEGAMVKGYATNQTDAAVLQNVIAAGYKQ
jgi:hypothetical protein